MNHFTPPTFLMSLTPYPRTSEFKSLTNTALPSHLTNPVDAWRLQVLTGRCINGLTSVPGIISSLCLSFKSSTQVWPNHMAWRRVLPARGAQMQELFYTNTCMCMCVPNSRKLGRFIKLKWKTKGPEEKGHKYSVKEKIWNLSFHIHVL